MGREPRYVPANSLQHVTDTTFQGRFLLRPSEELTERFLGVLGRAQRLYGMPICGVAVMSSHYHLLVRPRDGEHLAGFMCFFKANLSKEVGGRMLAWEGTFFDGRFHNTTVSDEAEAQVRILRYLLAQGTKEFLVERVLDWPGVHCARHLIDGTPMVGRWFDRSEEGKVGEEVGSVERVVLSPLPCWEPVGESVWRSAVADLVEELDREASAERRSTGRRCLGVEGVLRADPTERPAKRERSPKRRFHAASREASARMREAWSAVMAAYREASARLRSGDRGAEFPAGTFPPSLPFVPFREGVISREMPGTPGARGQPA